MDSVYENASGINNCLSHWKLFSKKVDMDMNWYKAAKENMSKA